MKAVLFLSLFLFVVPIASAETITTGNASSKTTVTNEVNGGDVYTKIEVEANGEKKILESKEEGTHSLSVESNDNGSEVSTEIETNIDLSPTETESTPSAEQEKEKINNPIQKIFQAISDFVEGILKLF